jgi:hypothetical protein
VCVTRRTKRYRYHKTRCVGPFRTSLQHASPLPSFTTVTKVRALVYLTASVVVVGERAE